MEQNDQDKVIKLHLEGKTYTQIANATGLGFSSIQRTVAKHKKAEAAAREQKLASLKKARKALAAKRKLGPIPMPEPAKAIMKAAQKPAVKQPAVVAEARPTIGINPSPETTLREIARAAAVLGLELHVQFVQRKA